MWNPWLIKPNLDLHTHSLQLGIAGVGLGVGACAATHWKQDSQLRVPAVSVAGSGSVCLMWLVLLLLLVKFHRVSREWKSEISLCRFSFAKSHSHSHCSCSCSHIHTCLAASLSVAPLCVWLILRIALFKNCSTLARRMKTISLGTPISAICTYFRVCESALREN